MLSESALAAVLDQYTLSVRAVHRTFVSQVVSLPQVLGFYPANCG